ncbi:UNVERIFIED_CONTAM: hypothetical protein K2H54_068357 [Gekko kuhli]
MHYRRQIFHVTQYELNAIAISVGRAIEGSGPVRRCPDQQLHCCSCGAAQRSQHRDRRLGHWARECGWARPPSVTPASWASTPVAPGEVGASAARGASSCHSASRAAAGHLSIPGAVPAASSSSATGQASGGGAES